MCVCFYIYIYIYITQTYIHTYCYTHTSSPALTDVPFPNRDPISIRYGFSANEETACLASANQHAAWALGTDIFVPQCLCLLPSFQVCVIFFFFSMISLISCKFPLYFICIYIHFTNVMNIIYTQNQYQHPSNCIFRLQ